MSLRRESLQTMKKRFHLSAKRAVLLALACLLSASGARAMCGAGRIGYKNTADGWSYFRTKIAGADPASFHVLPGLGSDPWYNPCASDSGYAADRFHVYRGAAVLPEADPATFSLLSYGYARDARHVYYMEKILIGANARTFSTATGGYFTDAAHVYLQGKTIPEADPATFQPFDRNSFYSGLARDSRHVFYNGTMIAGAGRDDAKPFDSQYWTSHGKIYFQDQLVAAAHAKTFKVAGQQTRAFMAEDATQFFLGAKPLSKAACRQVGEIVLACGGYLLSAGHKYSRIDSASIHYLGLFPDVQQLPRGCGVMAGSLIYQDLQGVYEFYGDGTVMKFADFQPVRQYSEVDKSLENSLCSQRGSDLVKQYR
jgi:DKNYY family